MAVKNEVIIAFLVTLLAMVVFGCLQGPPADTVDSIDSVEEPQVVSDTGILEADIAPIEPEVSGELGQPSE